MSQNVFLLAAIDELGNGDAGQGLHAQVKHQHQESGKGEFLTGKNTVCSYVLELSAW